MANEIDMVLDFQYGSTGKGLIAGWLAKRKPYDTAVCAFATNAGHTYIDSERGITMMTQQLPTSISSPTVKNVLIGPGSAIHGDTLLQEIQRYGDMLKGKRLMIHPQAAVVENYHARFEMEDGRTKMGSTAKGVGEAYIERIRRDPNHPNTVKRRWDRSLSLPTEEALAKFIVTEDDYRLALHQAENVIVEGAQGFSLSMYHGQYPYTTSRDVTPWQVAADCGLPFGWAPRIRVIGTLRTFPIRVNNRDGSSGPHYPDQRELTWEELGVPAENTTVTKLPRRVFTFSQQQLSDALFHCAAFDTKLFLNFVNYSRSSGELEELMNKIRATCSGTNRVHPQVTWLGNGPEDKDVVFLG